MTARTRLLDGALLLLLVFAVGLIGRTLFGMHTLGWPLTIRPWCTVAASLVVSVGAVGALRNRTWGLLLLLLATVSFAGALAFGIAPPYFGLMTLGGLVALGLAAPPLARRDPAALAVLVGLAVTLGVGAAALAGPGLDLVEANMLPT